MPGLGRRAEPRHLRYIQIIPVSEIVLPNTSENIGKDDSYYASVIAGSKMHPAICGKFSSL